MLALDCRRAIVGGIAYASAAEEAREARGRSMFHVRRALDASNAPEATRDAVVAVARKVQARDHIAGGQDRSAIIQTKDMFARAVGAPSSINSALKAGMTAVVPVGGVDKQSLLLTTQQAVEDQLDMAKRGKEAVVDYAEAMRAIADIVNEYPQLRADVISNFESSLEEQRGALVV